MVGGLYLSAGLVVPQDKKPTGHGTVYEPISASASAAC